MTSLPWLTILGAIPLVGALVVMVLPRDRGTLIKQVAFGFALVTLILTIVMGLQFQADSTAPFQFVESYPWVPEFGISYSVGVDGIGLVLVALAATLVPVVILAGWNDVSTEGRGVKGYFAWILVLETLMIGVFSATDVFLFYVYFEIMLIPVYFLIGRYGGPDRSRAAVKFLIYSLVGGLLMLAALIGLYVVSGDILADGTFSFTNVPAQSQGSGDLGYVVIVGDLKPQPVDIAVKTFTIVSFKRVSAGLKFRVTPGAWKQGTLIELTRDGAPTTKIEVTDPGKDLYIFAPDVPGFYQVQVSTSRGIVYGQNVQPVL